MLRATASFFILILLFGSLDAQQTGEVRGTITEEKGEVLPGVAITAKSPSLQGLRTAVSDKSGFFRLPLLPIGIYSLTFELPGFEKLTLTGNEVRLGFTASISITLKIAVLKEEVTVTATNLLIDKTKTDTSFRLKSEDLASTPTQARTIAEVVDLTPGVTGVRTDTVTGTDTGLPSFRGEGDAGNNWLVDGLSMKGALINDLGVRVNYDAWDEIQIISDGFAPEMGQALGGFVNIVTKSGGNDFHGELGGLIQDWHLRAKRREQLSVVSVPDTSLQQYFGNLGGPIIKDKLWFFLSDNFFGNVDRSSQQSIGWLTVPPGERRKNTNNAFGKITFTPQKNHTLSLSGTLDKFLHQTGGIGVPETYTKTDYTDYYYRLNYRGILSRNTLLTAAWGQYKLTNETIPLSGDFGPAGYLWQDIAQTTNNAFAQTTDIERRTDLSLGLTQYLDLGRWGNHEIGAGLSYYQNSWKGSWRFTGLDFDLWKGNGFDNGATITWTSQGIPLVLYECGPYQGNNATKGFGFFLQDNVTIGRFSFMLGVRTETQKIFNDAGERVWSWGLGDFLQPRVSLAIDLLGDGRNVLKFGYGRFANPQAIQNLNFFNRQPFACYRVHSWVGRENPNDAQLKDPASWEYSLEVSASATPEEVDPNLKPNRASRFLLEFDRQLGANWAFKIRGVYSYARNLCEDFGLYNPATQWLTYFYTNFELKKRAYRAFEVELNGRVSGRFMLNASYTWSQAKGTVPGNFTERVGWDNPGGSGYEIGFFGDRPYVPPGFPNKEVLDSIFFGLGGRGIGDEGWYGFLPYSVDHLIKILGTYFAPYGFNISSSIEYLSGYHWEKKGLSPAYGFYLTFPEGRGGRLTPAHMYVDLAIEKDFRLMRGATLGLGINVYNLTNSQRPVSFVKEDTALFGRVWGRQLPRWLQFKAALRF